MTRLSKGPLRLDFLRGENGFGFSLRFEGRSVAGSPRPLRIQLLDSRGAADADLAAYREVRVRGGRDQAVHAQAVGSMRLEGARLEVEDSFALARDAIEIRRRVRVGGGILGMGFASALDLTIVGATLDDPWFFPGLWYGDNDRAPSYAIGSPAMRSRYPRFLFREDRLALPLALHFDEKRSAYLAVCRLGARATTVPDDDNDEPLIDERLAFGAFGLATPEPAPRQGGGATLSFTFPGCEGPLLYAPMWTIERGNRQSDSPVNPFTAKRASPRSEGWLWRGHPLADGFTHDYALRIEYGRAPSFPAAASGAWRRLWKGYRPRVRRAPLRRIERLSIDLLDRLVVERADSSGIPTWIDCFTGKPGRLQDDFSIGFVSRNLEVAYVLIEAGWRRRSQALRSRGERIVDFWARRGGSGLSHTEYDYRSAAWIDRTTEAGRPFVYLRDQSEAHRVCLACIASERRRGVERTGWLEWARSFGDWVIDHRNGDGSLFRAYELSGAPAEASTADCAHVAGYLCDLAAATGERRYLEAARATAEYLWSTFHHKGIYFGATLDNPDCIDKEASALALDGYLRLYESTGERRWLEAADSAARVCESWIIAWEIPMPVEPGVPRFYAPGKTTVGLQLITTGFSAVDMFLGRQSGDLFRLARYTRDRHWVEVARILLHNTKCMVQLAGEHGYRYDGFQIEHWEIGRGRGYGLNSGWLPWVASSNVISIWTRSARRSLRAVEQLAGDRTPHRPER